MQIGVVFPQIEFPPEPEAIKDYAQAVEGLGYRYILAYDHVLGANPDRPGGWKGPYTYQNPFREPFVLFSFMSGITRELGFATGVIILPQRQTVLVAKQAADLDILCGGRLRLGIGLGWNYVEYEALGKDFHTRGRRIGEQVELMRRLWMEPLVTFQGKDHTITDAGIKPLPVQRPIPVWFGGTAPAALKRAARLGDGWMTNYRNPEDARPALDLIMRELENHKKSPQSSGLDARLTYGSGDLDGLVSTMAAWEGLGANYVSINTMGSGFEKPQDHIQALERFAKEAGVKNIVG